MSQIILSALVTAVIEQVRKRERLKKIQKSSLNKEERQKRHKDNRIVRVKYWDHG